MAFELYGIANVICNICQQAVKQKMSYYYFVKIGKLLHLKEEESVGIKPHNLTKFGIFQTLLSMVLLLRLCHLQNASCFQNCANIFL